MVSCSCVILRAVSVFFFIIIWNGQMARIPKAARRSAPVLRYPHYPTEVSKIIFFRVHFQPLMFVLCIMPIMSICRTFRLWEQLWCYLSVFFTPEKKSLVHQYFHIDHEFQTTNNFVLSPQQFLVHTYFSWYSILRTEHKVLLEILSTVSIVEVITQVCCIAHIIV